MVEIILRVVILSVIITIIGILIHFIKLAINIAIDPGYRKKLRLEKETSLIMKEKIKKLKSISNIKEFNDNIYDAFNNPFDIREYKKFEQNLYDFSDEKNIVNWIYDALMSKNLFGLEMAFEDLIGKKIDNEALVTYIDVIDEVRDEKNKINRNYDNFEINYKKIIQSKLLKNRKDLLRKKIENYKAEIENEINTLHNNNQSLNKLDLNNLISNDNLFSKLFTEKKHLIDKINEIGKFEIINKFINDIKKELKL